MKKGIVTLLAALVLLAGLTLTTAAPSDAMIRSVDRFGSRVAGGVITSPHLHVTVSITGKYRTVRKVRYRNGSHHRKAFWGVTVSAQHCKPSGCWGSIKHGRLAVGYPRGRAVSARETAPAIGCWIHACVSPLQWAKNGAQKVGGFSNWLGKSDEWFFKNITLPCITGAGGGWVKTQAENVSRKLVFLGGWMSRAKYAASVEGPEGYAVAGVAGCGLTLGAVGAIKPARSLGG